MIAYYFQYSYSYRTGILTKANVDDREVQHELSEIVDITILFGDKGYVGTISKKLKQGKGIQLYTLKRGNSKNPLPKTFRNLISKLRRRIETTFNQLIEHFKNQIPFYGFLLC